MNTSNLDEVEDYISKEIITFHKAKLKCLEQLDLKKILKKKNPYLFKAKNINVASDLICELMDAVLSASEEKIFGDFLENLAIFVAKKIYNGWKSSSTGVDLELTKDDTHFLVSVKSGPNWGNSSQQKKQETDFQKAIAVLKQSRHTINVQPILGICYGKTKTKYLRGYMKIVGQNFWHFLSGNKEFYTDIIEPLGHKTREHNEYFRKKKDVLINIFTKEFLNSDFCQNGNIDWKKVVEFNSGNLKDK